MEEARDFCQWVEWERRTGLKREFVGGGVYRTWLLRGLREMTAAVLKFKYGKCLREGRKSG